MKNSNFILLFNLMWLAVVSACTAASQYPPAVTPQELFGVTDTLSGEYLPEKLEPNGFTRVYYTQYGLLCEGNKVWKKDNHFLRLIDSVSGEKIFSAGLHGRGPGEMLSWWGCDYDEKSGIYYTYDMMSRNIGRYRLTPGGIETLPPVHSTTGIYWMTALSDTTFCIVNFFPDQSISIIDDKGNYLSRIPNRPVMDKRINYNARNFYFHTWIKNTPDNEILVAADPDYNSIQVYSTRDNNLRLLCDTVYIKPEYIIRNDKPILRKSHIMGGGFLYVTNRYIYIITALETWGEMLSETRRANIQPTLLIFDLSCRFLGGYVLDHPVYSTFTVSPDNKTIYIYSYDKRDNSRIVKYRLPYLK